MYCFSLASDLLNFITQNSEKVNEDNVAEHMLKGLSQLPGRSSEFSYDTPIVNEIKKKVRKQKQPFTTIANLVKDVSLVDFPKQYVQFSTPSATRLVKDVPMYANGNQRVRLAGLGSNPNCQVQYVFQDESPQHEYCICPDLSYGFTCNEGFGNPCASMKEQFHVASPQISKNYFIHCNWNVPYLKMCPQNLVW